MPLVLGTEDLLTDLGEVATTISEPSEMKPMSMKQTI